MDARYREAADLAAAYNWPAESALLRQGRPPERFGREVGANIALFLVRPVVGIGTRELLDREEAEGRQHARRLARLRVLLALLSIEARK
jgi:hypothetical protein